MKWSVTLTDRLGPEMLTVLEIKGQVLHRVHLHVKVPGLLLNLNALLTNSTVFRLVTTTTNKSTVLQWGTKMGPSYANLFVGFIENKFFSNYHGPKPDLYKRYIDDCVGATSSTKEELNLFINSVIPFTRL